MWADLGSLLDEFMQSESEEDHNKTLCKPKVQSKEKFISKSCWENESECAIDRIRFKHERVRLRELQTLERFNRTLKKQVSKPADITLEVAQSISITDVHFRMNDYMDKETQVLYRYCIADGRLYKRRIPCYLLQNDHVNYNEPQTLICNIKTRRLLKRPKSRVKCTKNDN